MEQQMALSPEQAAYMAQVANPTLAKITAALLAQQPDAACIDAFIAKLLTAPTSPAAKASTIELLHFNDVYVRSTFINEFVTISTCTTSSRVTATL
jgi:hypothetical protein